MVIKQGQGKRQKLTFVLAEVAWFMGRPENRSTGILSLGSMVFGFFIPVGNHSINWTILFVKYSESCFRY